MTANAHTMPRFAFFILLPLTIAAVAQESSVVDPAHFQGLEFRMIGPTRGGRVTAVTGHRDHPYTFYMGATGGGVWKTTDYGTTWSNISDGFFETGSIGSIDIADTDPNVLYVGTGSEGLRSNVIVGRGVYKSVDAGATWQFAGLRDAGQIGAVVIHPTNPAIGYVAALGNPFGPNAERGVYRTVDGGKSWEQLLHISERTGAVDLELHPSDSDIIYAAMWRLERKPWTIISGDGVENGLYVSRDAGALWTKVTDGLPGGDTGKIDLAVSPADPSRVYALVEARPEDEGLYRSDDEGRTWRLVNSAPYLMTRPFYYTNVDADPTDADIIWVNNLGLHVSRNGGNNFERVATPHGDNHDMWINPDDPRIMIQSNDGGANVTLDGGNSWSTQHNQPTAELYQVNVDNRFPYWVYAGQQDNSTIAVPSIPPDYRPGGPTRYWEAVGGCETGPAVPHPEDLDIVYSNCKGKFSKYSRRSGQEQHYYVGGVDMYGVNPSTLPYRFQRVVPIEVSPHDSRIIYHGSQHVHRTVDEGKTWAMISDDLTAFRPERQVISGGPITRDITGEEHYSTLYVIEASPVEEHVIWTGANDGPVHVTRDEGRTWIDVTPPDMPPEGRIQSIEPSPHTVGKAYIAGYRYLLGDFAPYLYRTQDYGATWTRITDGIPSDSPTRVVREDPSRPGLLYAGTEFGLYISFNDGVNWQSFQQNLPVTPVTDIKVHRQDLILSTMGRSFWIMDNLTPLHNLTPGVAAAERYLFPIRDAYRLRYRSGGADASEPQYISPGAIIDYYFAEQIAGTVKMTITDDTGAIVRTLVVGDRSGQNESTQGMRGPTRMGRSQELKTEAGMHRFVWDLRHAAPENLGRTGPVVPPGKYAVMLEAEGWSSIRSVDVLLDPRVEESGVRLEDLNAQFAFNMQTLKLLSDATDLAEAINDSIVGLNSAEEIEYCANNVYEGCLQDVESLFEYRRPMIALKAELETERGDSYPAPMLIDQLEYLYNFTSRGDQVPGSDAYTRLHELQQKLEVLRINRDSSAYHMNSLMMRLWETRSGGNKSRR